MESQTQTQSIGKLYSQKEKEKVSYKNVNIYAGIDAHLKSWKVTIMTEHLVYKTFSQDPKPELLYEHLVKNYPGGIYHSAYEAGFCGYWIHNRLTALGINSIVANPADIPTTDKEKVQKEDARDSRKIAKSLMNKDLKPIYVPTIKTLADRSLMRARATLVKELTRNKNRTKSFLHFYGIEIPERFSGQTVWSKAFVNWLNSIELPEKTGRDALDTYIKASVDTRASLLRILRLIRALSETPEYKEQVILLRSIPGIALITAMTLLTELENIHRFESFDRLCAFIGFIPSTSSSGDWDGTGDITRRGHSVLRKTIIESTWMAIRRDPALAKSYHDYCKRMEANKAIVRVAKKLLNRIKFVLKNKQAYEYAVVK